MKITNGRKIIKCWYWWKNKQIIKIIGMIFIIINYTKKKISDKSKKNNNQISNNQNRH